ncbi:MULTISPECIES: thioesterase II family protein [Streptomyces]|uniref:Oleoyl-ACP hydrolase n=1 Tax=Streptomyces alboflavus TaxID=67267 RepID=A0A1Z1W5M9_9ACTN|nr:alpha/beta fold hydrolase [Streptomyces alboflavus]ARX81714.1 oleoyl-ACP hydrolase [Streptomyces alboflavus]
MTTESNPRAHRPGVNSAAPTPRWLRRTQPRPGARTTLVCFPHAGGTASSFTPWARLLPLDVELVAVQYPGRQDRLAERPIATMTELADAVTEALRAGVRPDRELIFFGHSMGAALAWETALRLEAGPGPAPRQVFVSGRQGPRRQRPGTVHLLPEERLVDEIKQLGGTDPQLLDDPDMREIVLPAIRADYRLIETYRPDLTARLRCPIGVFTGDQDTEVSPEDVEAWRDAGSGDFSALVLPGDHFYLTDQAERVISSMFASRTV